MEMESTTKKSNEILHDLSPLFLMYKDGRIERFVDSSRSPWVPPGLDPETGVESKDITVLPDRGVSVRLYKPKPINPKLPVLVYFHGGGFCIESTFSSLYHPYLNRVACRGGTMVVSVEYRLAPEHPLPAAFDDCWDALTWLFSHSATPIDSSNKEEWIQENADLSRVYMGGDSAGANITHQMAMRIGTQGLPGASINGIILFHPGFWGKDRIGDEVVKLTLEQNPELPNKLWAVMWPGSSGLDDPWINPAHDPNLSRLGCERVLIFVAEKDVSRDRGWLYKEILEKSGWQGKVEVVESQGEGHVFYLFNPFSKNADDVMSKVVHFLNPPHSS